MRTITVAILATLTLGLSACGSDSPYPYTSEQMTRANNKCATEASFALQAGGIPGNYLDCLRSRLPDLTDEQLERLGSVIDKAEKAER